MRDTVHALIEQQGEDRGIDPETIEAAQETAMERLKDDEWHEHTASYVAYRALVDTVKDPETWAGDQ